MLTMKRGRPRVPVAADQVREMKESGMSYRKIAQELSISRSTAHRIDKSLSMQPANFGTPSPAILEAR